MDSFFCKNDNKENIIIFFQIDLKVLDREYLRGKYRYTIDLLFDWFGLASFANKNKNCQLSYS
jgi:hypothetical protein